MELRLVNDYIFKAVFGTESNKRVLIALLNAILDYPEDEKVVEIELMNPFSEQNFGEEKVIVMDIKAHDSAGRLYNVEVQISPPLDYVNRAVYYMTKLFSSQLVKGESYRYLARTIGISIISDRPVFKNLSPVHNVFRYKHVKENIELGDPTEIHFIELVKFDKTKPAELRTKLEKWLNFLKFGEEYRIEGNLPKELESEDEISMAMDTYRRVTESDRFRQMMADREQARTDRLSELFNAREEGLEAGRAEGIKLGIAEGIEKGIAEGRAEGIAEGKAEGKAEGIAEGIIEERKNILRNLLQFGLPMQQIIQITGLSEEEIKAFGV